MAKQPRDMTKFVAALCADRGVQNVGELVKTPAYQEAFAKSGGDPMEAAEILNRRKTPGATVPAWFIRATRLQEFDQTQNGGKGGFVDKGPGVEVLLPNQRTRTYPHGGDLSAVKPLTPVSIAGVTVLRKVYEATEDYTGLEDGKFTLTAHTAALPPADPEWAFAPGGDGRDPGPIFKLDKKLSVIQGDTGDRPIFGIYEITTPTRDDVRVSDGKFDKKKRVSVQATVKTPGGRKMKAKFYNVGELARRFSLDETSKSEEWADVLDGKKFAALGKIGALHPRGPGDFESEGTPKDQWKNLSSTIEELDAAGCIAKAPIKKGKNAGKLFQQLDLTKAPLQKKPDGTEVRPTYVNINNRPEKVYRLEKKGDDEWQASVLATDVGGFPWLSFTEGDAPAEEGGKQYGAGFFVVFLDDLPGQKKVIDVANPFAQALTSQGLAKFA